MSSDRIGFWRNVRLIAGAIALVAALGFASCGDDDGGSPTGGNDEDIVPVIDSMRVSVPVTAPGDSVQIWCYAHDADGDSIEYTWQAEDGAIVGSDSTVKWIAATGNRSHAINVTINDGRQGVVVDDVVVEVMEGTLLVQSRDGLIADGALEAWVEMPNPSNESLQNIDGVVVGSRLILSENGTTKSSPSI